MSEDLKALYMSVLYYNDKLRVKTRDDKIMIGRFSVWGNHWVWDIFLRGHNYDAK